MEFCQYFFRSTDLQFFAPFLYVCSTCLVYLYLTSIIKVLFMCAVSQSARLRVQILFFTFTIFLEFFGHEHGTIGRIFIRNQFFGIFTISASIVSGTTSISLSLINLKSILFFRTYSFVFPSC